MLVELQNPTRVISFSSKELSHHWCRRNLDVIQLQLLEVLQLVAAVQTCTNHFQS